MASQADQFYYSQIGCKVNRSIGSVANQFLEARESCLGHMECHMLTILFALQLWDPESNPIWVFFSGITGWRWSRAEHPVLGEMGGHRLALGCFQHFPLLSDFTSLLLYAGELRGRRFKFAEVICLSAEARWNMRSQREREHWVRSVEEAMKISQKTEIQ